MKVRIDIEDPTVRCVSFEPGMKRVETDDLHIVLTNEQFKVFCKGIARAWKEWTGDRL